MAFNIPNEGVPFYRPVAPEVPVAPRGAEGDRLGSSLISAMTQHAIAMENNRVDEEKLVQAADLKARELELDAQKSSMEYGLRKQYYDILSANAGTNRLHAQTMFERVMQGNKDAADINDQVGKLNADVDTRMKELKVVDPEYQAKFPNHFAAGVLKLWDEYGDAPAYTGIPGKLAKLQRIADQQKIPVRYGATQDADGNWHGAEARMVPRWQVVRDYQDPATHDYTAKALKASGFITEKTEDVDGKDDRNWFQKNVPFLKTPVPKVPKTTETLDPRLQAGVDEKADFGHSASRLPDIVPKSTRAQAAKYGDKFYDPRTNNSGRLSPRADMPEENPLTEPDLPPDASPDSTPPDANAAPASQYTPEPTQTDMILGHARNALAVNPGARDEIMRRLQGYGIDPNALTAA